jgi:hypothetical protein
VVLDFNDLLVLLSLLILASLHDASDVHREEPRFDRVDDVEEELSADTLVLAFLDLAICSSHT